MKAYILNKMDVGFHYQSVPDVQKFSRQDSNNSKGAHL